MILPTKHTTIEQSLLGFGCYILQILEEGDTVESLWDKYQKDYNGKVYKAKHTYDNMILTLIFLYCLGIIEEEDGEIKKCN